MKKYLFFILIVIYYGAHGQSTISLSLDEAITLAIKNKPSIKIASLDATIAKQKLAESKRKYITDVSSEFVVQYNPTIATNIIPIGQFNTQNPTDETRAIQFGQPWSNTAGIKAKQVLFDPAIQSEIKERKTELAIAELSTQTEQVNLRYEVAKAYYSVLLTREELKFAVSDTLRAFQLYKLAADRFTEKQIKITEKNQASYALAKTRYNFINAQSNLNNAVSKFCFTIGLSQNTTVELTTDFSTLLPVNQVPANDSLSFVQRPDYKKAVYQNLLSVQQSRSEKVKLLPTLSINGFLGANQFTRQFSLVENNSWFGNSYVNLTLQVPITKFFTQAKRIEQFNSQAKQNEQELIKLKEQYRYDTNLTLTKLATLHNRYQLQLSNLTLAQQNYDDSKANYEQGQVLITELSTQEANVQAAQYELLTVIHDVLIQQLELKKLNGFATAKK